jgi:hypothetical protein
LSPAALVLASVACAWWARWRAPGAASRCVGPATRLAVALLLLIGGVVVNLVVGYNATAWPGAGMALVLALCLPLSVLAFAGTASVGGRWARAVAAVRRPVGAGRPVGVTLADVAAGVGLVAAGVAVRLPWLDATGYGGDVKMYAGWGEHVATYGLAAAYATEDLTHGPMFVGSTGLMALLWRTLAPLLGGAGEVPVSWIKVPGLLADLAVGLLLFGVARRAWRTPAAAGLALLFLLNPGVVLDSAWWGQTDSQAALWVTAAVVAAGAGRAAPSGALGALALLTKLQAYFVAPLTALAAWRTGGWRGLAAAGGAAGATVLVVCAPLLLSGEPLRLVEVYAHLVGRHPLTNVGAFNVWWLGLGWRGYALTDDALFAGGALPLTLRQVGLVALGGYSLLILGRLWVRFEPAEVPLAAVALAMAFFMLPTQIHSRYLYTVLPLLLVAAVARPALLLAYAALSVTFLVNQVHLILRASGGWPEVLPAPPALTTLDALGLTPEAMTLVNLAVFGVLTWLVLRPLWPDVQERLVALSRSLGPAAGDAGRPL